MSVLLAFFTSTIGRFAFAGLVVVGLLLGTYAKGRWDGAAKCEAAWADRVVEEIARQQEAASKALEAAEKRAAEAAEESARLQGQVEEFEKKLDERPSCQLSEEEARELERIK